MTNLDYHRKNVGYYSGIRSWDNRVFLFRNRTHEIVNSSSSFTNILEENTEFLPKIKSIFHKIIFTNTNCYFWQRCMQNSLG